MSEMQRDGSEMRCKRCGANESRIHGFCSVECEHYFDYEEEIADLNARIRALESDGSHTFAELYHHRAVLFSVVTNDHLGISWKSRLHEDGTMFDGYFIVGILTPEGMFSYHYEMKEWDLFECKELPRAPKWDGHTPDDVWRLSSLARASWNTRPIEDALNARIAELEEAQRWIPVGERLPEEKQNVLALDKTGTAYHWEYSRSLSNIFVSDYTHWMPLPEPPEEERC